MTRGCIIASAPTITDGAERSDRNGAASEEGFLRVSEEKVLLVDADDLPVGAAGKLDAHRLNLRHRAISVLVFDPAGRMLVQRRAAGKYHSPGLWANACCTHPRHGEAAVDAALRRLGEEMGIALPLAFAGLFPYQAQVGDGLWENEIVHVFTGIYEGEVSPNPDEVGTHEWRDVAFLRADIAANGARYAPWFRLYAAAPWFAGPAR
jgi:isopentenyl-diphosphate delta-isomerase